MKKNESIWKETIEKEACPALTNTVKKDAVVIGGGLAGILTAYFLQQKGLEVAVLEADRVASGQTGRTTAKITSQHGVIYQNLIAWFGKSGAAEYARRNQQAIEDYEELIHKEKIDCDFKRLPAYLYTKKQQSVLKREQEAAKSLGIECRLHQETELPFQVSEALEFENQAQFHPLKFLTAISPTLEIYEKTPVVKVEGRRVITTKGGVLAGIAIFASHYPFINRPGYYFMRMHQERSYAAALKNAQELAGMYYGIDSDFGWSMRSAGQELILGGCNHRTGNIPQQDPFEALEAKAREFWPDCGVTHCWSAQDCMTADHVPYIGSFSRHNQSWYVATGFNKWGMTSSMVSARILADKITKSKAEPDIFSPQRFKWSVELPSMLKDGMISTKNLVAAWAGAAPKCPHLGCRLKWNPLEKTWECQCHGSRFDEEGGLLDNPAQTDLLKEETR